MARSTWIVGIAVVGLAAVIGFFPYDFTPAPLPDSGDAEAVGGSATAQAAAPRRSAKSDWDARRAFGYLARICRIGPRYSGSEGMGQQQRLIADHFTDLGGRVSFQSFDVAHPLNGAPVRMNNLMVTWHPDAKERVLFCCHYDTRPFPDQDRRNPRGLFVGANDGASGVALLMELGHRMSQIKPDLGVDFVFFDGEELVYGDRGKYFHGSEHFATTYREQPPEHRYRFGVLVDMIGDRRLNLYQEKNSLRHARRLTESLWETARQLGIREFIAEPRYEVNDDHIPLNEIAGIPTCDIIDFDYPYWHTMQDLPDRCSGSSLVKVGRVLEAWLTQIPAADETRSP